MRAWGVWVWVIGEETEADGHWHEDEGGVPYVFYHAGAALAVADVVVVMDHHLISAIREFDSTGQPKPFVLADKGREAARELSNVAP